MKQNETEWNRMKQKKKTERNRVRKKQICKKKKKEPQQLLESKGCFCKGNGRNRILFLVLITHHLSDFPGPFERFN